MFLTSIRALRRRLRALDRAGVVKLLSQVPGADLAALYRAAELVAVPSLAEGFGLPVAEAMACGAPVVTSDRSSMPEVAGTAALLVDPEDPVAIAGVEEARLEGLDFRDIHRACVASHGHGIGGHDPWIIEPHDTFQGRLLGSPRTGNAFSRR